MGDPKHDGLAIPGRVVLAHEPPFSLGSLRVDPPTRQVHDGRGQETLEPRVMEVLVALACARGTIVTREELIARCWGGRIVTDDAINRVLSRIRNLANHIGRGSFALETITKVGYRLVEPRTKDKLGPVGQIDMTGEEPLKSRREWMAGAGAVTVALGLTGVLWRKPWSHKAPIEAEQLYLRGLVASREGAPGSVRQMVSYFERAVAIDPDYADAWGALALSYSHLLEGHDEAELASLPSRIRAAAQRALKLDADNADAQLALIFLTPYFRNWATKETQLARVTEKHARHWLARGRLAVLFYQVGRLADGVEMHRKALEIEPVVPLPYAYMINNLSAAGRPQEAEELIDRAHDRWPAHAALWAATFTHLLYSGRPRSAAAFAVYPDSLPTGFGQAQLEPRLRLARAIETDRRGDVEASVKDHMDLAWTDVTSIPDAAMAFAALGRSDLTFASLERYFFNRSSFGEPAPIGPYTRRHTNVLFTLPMIPLRGDIRFARLLRDVGLEGYWRKTRTLPDYRRR